MRSTVIAVALLSACLASAQQIKQPKATVPDVKEHSAVAPPPIVNTSSTSSAAQLAKIEQQTARVRASKPVAHSSNTVAPTPALDLGKNKPVRSARSPQPGLPNSH